MLHARLCGADPAYRASLVYGFERKFRISNRRMRCVFENYRYNISSQLSGA